MRLDIDGVDIDSLLNRLLNKYKDNKIVKKDGLKIFFDKHEWALIRKSNTEPKLSVRFHATTKNNFNIIKKRIIKDLT